MEEELWCATKPGGGEAYLTKASESTYHLFLDDKGIELDRKHLKDLFDAIGNELKMF